ncbi:MAG: L-serine ammonia-lyase [Pseudomonadota bacterium]
MFSSVFELFKLGIGPSSSHTMWPMVAAGLFLNELKSPDWPRPAGVEPIRLRAHLYGSLALTGVGHATDRAVALGLDGADPARIDPDEMDSRLREIRRTDRVSPAGHEGYAFAFYQDIVFHKSEVLPLHPNGIALEALDAHDRVMLRRVYYSIGGGTVRREEELIARSPLPNPTRKSDVPYPFENASQMLAMARASDLSIAQMKRMNEEKFRSRSQVNGALDEIWEAMDSSIERGLMADGVLPGGLNVQRRAGALSNQLGAERGLNTPNPVEANEWLAVYAMAVNEENAAGSRVVAAPTNGAAGVVPAVLKYANVFLGKADREDIRQFLLTAAAIGGIIKSNASISGAEVGCQGEVGSAAAMAAAGLAALMGGTPEQIENAAEIALEHHLGMTCDPVAGLVQVPCIERNGVGAVKAVLAATLAVRESGAHVVSLDACIKTMRQTGADMSAKYKETSLGGLAVNVTDC